MERGCVEAEELAHILLVEDDDIDAEAMVRAFRTHWRNSPMTIAKDGLEALALLQGGGNRRLSQPYLILLDINMPRMSGLEFLSVLRQDERLKRSIVFVLTTSDRPEDKMAAYDYQVAGYLLKSRNGEDFRELIELLRSYGQIVEFPPETAQ